MSFSNLPTKESGIQIVCKKDEDGNYHIYTGEGWTITRIYSDWELASLVGWARDQGFKHAQHHVRNAIGL